MNTFLFSKHINTQKDKLVTILAAQSASLEFDWLLKNMPRVAQFFGNRSDWPITLWLVLIKEQNKAVDWWTANQVSVVMSIISILYLRAASGDLHLSARNDYASLARENYKERYRP